MQKSEKSMDQLLRQWWLPSSYWAYPALGPPTFALAPLLGESCNLALGVSLWAIEELTRADYEKKPWFHAFEPWCFFRVYDTIHINLIESLSRTHVTLSRLGSIRKVSNK